VSTVAWVGVPKTPGASTRVTCRNGKSYTTCQPISIGVFNYEDQETQDLIERIQTTNRLKLAKPRLVNDSSAEVIRELLLTNADKNGATVINTTVAHSSDNDKWRVAFGYMRTNICGLVEPGICIPGKYRYLAFESRQEAVGFRQYMMTHLVRLIVSISYNSRTLDNPQLKLVPVFDDYSVFAVEDVEGVVNKTFGISPDLAEKIRLRIADQVPF